MFDCRGDSWSGKFFFDITRFNFNGICREYIVLILFLFFPYLSVVSRRFKDLNQGDIYFWIYVISGMVPVIYVSLTLSCPPFCSIVEDAIGSENFLYSFIGFFLGGVITNLLSLINFCRRGTAGKNRFGEDPLAEKHEISEIEQRISQSDNSAE